MRMQKDGISFGGYETVTRELTIPATAGNAAWTSAVPAGKKWHFLRLKLVVITDATVANRLVVTGFTNSAGLIGKDIAAASAAITASLTRGVIIHDNIELSYTPSAGIDGVTYIATVNFGGYGFNGDLVEVGLAAGVAGDSFSGSLLVEETT